MGSTGKVDMGSTGKVDMGSTGKVDELKGSGSRAGTTQGGMHPTKGSKVSASVSSVPLSSEDAFMQLLDDEEVDPSSEWKDVAGGLHDDPRFSRMPSRGARKQAFDAWKAKKRR